MKKITSIIIVVLLCINVLQICSCNEKAKTNDKPVRSRVGGHPPPAVTDIRSILEGDHSDYTPIDSLDGLIEDSLAWVMSELYRTNVNKSTINIAHHQVDDTRSVWFSLSTLQAFIDEINRSIPESITANRPKLGIRVYFGIYPARNDYGRYPILKHSDPAVTERRQTVFFVPCYMDSTDHKKYIDFNYNYVGNPLYPTPYYKLLESYGFALKPAALVGGFNKRDFIVPGGINPPDAFFAIAPGESIQNHGGMVPPPAGTGSFPTPSEN